ncbi:hypothetical protein DM02DRAFT_683049 [Periconia macrospinosa]|uniref:Zn(2)-C6 fungal-type domain-containing protein n=1 Tax=Periconia macrospinosa TaxID=97972 RepID=A0A2V1DKM1_9PLEO|nr:hypothetical protein DM02DRAFT_683049 [Periconia macrospinosa]
MACRRCYQKKIKCFGGDPTSNLACRYCRSARAECTYPTRHKNVTVSESYLKALENAVNQMATPVTSLPPNSNPSRVTPAMSSKRRFVEDTTGDAFVIRLRNLATNDRETSWTGEGGGNGTSSALREVQSVPPYEYFSLQSDQPATNITLKLPPYPYAIHLVNQFETYMGYEYHWYLRKSFRERLELTYTDPQSDAGKDRTWLCRLLVVLALGETYNSKVPPWIQVGRDATPNSINPERPPPGVGFFENAISLFKTPFEEATIDHVEVLNLITFYSYSLGRRRSAFVYSGLAIRIAASLMLHSPVACNTTYSGDSEHRRRIWWTTYQLDGMTGSDLGLNATYEFEEIEAKLGLPSDENLSQENQDEFTPCAILTAHLCLCSVRSGILSVAGAGLSHAELEQVEASLTPPINILEEWHQQLPESIKFDFSAGIPSAVIGLPECRSLASLYLRFHQCFVLLLRPVVLRFLASAIRRDSREVEHPSLTDLCNRCIAMARQNLIILNSLWGIDRIAKFGFWESLHLFSSIKIFLVASIINLIRPFSITFDDINDRMLYENSKRLLHEMADFGNMSSRGHCSLLEDLEQTRELIIGRVQSNAADGLVLPDFEVNIDQWLAMLNASPNTSFH